MKIEKIKKKGKSNKSIGHEVSARPVIVVWGGLTIKRETITKNGIKKSQKKRE